LFNYNGGIIMDGIEEEGSELESVWEKYDFNSPNAKYTLEEVEEDLVLLLKKIRGE